MRYCIVQMDQVWMYLLMEVDVSIDGNINNSSIDRKKRQTIFNIAMSLVPLN